MTKAEEIICARKTNVNLSEEDKLLVGVFGEHYGTVDFSAVPKATNGMVFDYIIPYKWSLVFFKDGNAVGSLSKNCVAYRSFVELVKEHVDKLKAHKKGFFELRMAERTSRTGNKYIAVTGIVLKNPILPMNASNSTFDLMGVEE